MEKCLHRYKQFYVTFIYVVRLKLGETRSVSNLFKCLLIKSPEIAAEDKAKRLELLLFKILHESASGRFRITPRPNIEVSKNRECDCNPDTDDCCCFASQSSCETIGLEWKDPVFYASKLLIELSTFQMSVSANSSFRGNNCRFCVRIVAFIFVQRLSRSYYPF